MSPQSTDRVLSPRTPKSYHQLHQAWQVSPVAHVAWVQWFLLDNALGLVELCVY